MKYELKYLFKYIKPHLFKLIIAFICSLIYVGFNIYIPIAAGLGLDQLKGNINIDNLMFYIYSILISMLISSIFYWILSYLASVTSYKVSNDIRKDTFNHLIECKISEIDKSTYGDIVSIIGNDVSLICEGIIQMFIQLFTGIFTIIGTLVMMFIFSYQLALIVMVLTPISIICASLIAKGTAKTFTNQSKYRGKLLALINENVTNQKIIIANNGQEKCESDFKNIASDLKGYDLKAGFYSSIINPTTRLINSIIYLIAVTVGALFIFNDTISMTTGNLMSFLMFTNNYTNPFNEISEVIANLQTAYASLKRVHRLNEMELVDEVNNKVDIKEMNEIEFDHVSFSYDNKNNVIDDVSFKISKGEHVAIVGKTGCGKTTLINLIMKFYKVNSGSIKINGIDINNIEDNKLRENISMVLQDTWIFKGSVYDNISYSCKDVKYEDVINSSKFLGADFFITQLKDGYQTIVSNDSGLSIGQKQLLCITRLFLNSPNILILDEATSNIDTLNEKIIQKDFDKIMENKTSIVIAHRLSTIQNADVILVMDKGKIIEKGKHEDLLKHKGAYYQLYMSQFAI